MSAVLRLIQSVYLLRSVWAVLLALIIGGLLISTTGANPIAAYKALFGGAFLDYYGFSDTLVKFSPIVLAGLAVAIPLRSNLYNIGAEGQIYMGGLFGAAAALYLPESLPAGLHLVLCTLGGALGGGLWAAIPGYLKAYRNINEVIVTLLMNYVAINLISYFAGGPMMQPGAPYPYSNEISEALWLPHIMPGTNAHLGAAVGLVMCIVAWAVLRYTTMGFRLDLVGMSPPAALYAGINVRRQILVTMFVAGAMAGMAGAFEVIGLRYRLYHLFSPNYGADGIVTAFLAGLNPILVPVSALFLSGLKAGAQVMQRAMGLESTIVEAITGLVVIFVAASLAFRFDPQWWRLKLKGRRELNELIGGSEDERESV